MLKLQRAYDSHKQTDSFLLDFAHLWEISTLDIRMAQLTLAPRTQTSKCQLIYVHTHSSADSSDIVTNNLNFLKNHHSYPCTSFAYTMGLCVMPTASYPSLLMPFTLFQKCMQLATYCKCHKNIDIVWASMLQK